MRKKSFWIIALVSLLVFGQLSFSQKPVSSTDETKYKEKSIQNEGEFTGKITPGIVNPKISVTEKEQMLFVQAQGNIQTAQLALELAKQRLENLILQIRLDLKVPDDYEGKIDKNGIIYFEKRELPKETVPPK